MAGMTAPTEHNHPIISIRLWLCMYVSTFLQQRLRGGRKRQTCVCVCARACTSVYLCIYVVLSHFNHTEQDLDLLSGVLELDFFLPDLDETVHVLLSEAAQLNQDETSNPPPFGDWHCEHSPANGRISDKDRESLPPFLLLHLEIEKEYEAINFNGCSLACTSVITGTDFILFTLSLLYFIWRKGPYGENSFCFVFWGGRENLSFVCVICFLCVYYSRHSHYTFPGCFLGKQSG